MSTARSSALARRSPGRSADSIRIIGRTRATTRWSPISRRPGTSCGSRTGRVTCMIPSRPSPSCGSSSRACGSGWGRALPLEFRMDAAFCQRDVFRLLAARRCAYAIKVGYWSWLPLKALAATRQRWEPLAPDVAGFMTDLAIPQWSLQLRVMLYRKHVQHETPKNFQLDLFTPNDGHFEYYAVATNMALGLPALYAFVCGRGVQEKTFGELKGEFALDVVPTRHYGANSAWQQLSILAHNIARSFQLDTLATPKPRSRKRTYAYVLRSMRTLRCLPIARAGRLTRIDGRNVLRLAANPATEQLYAKVAHALAA